MHERRLVLEPKHSDFRPPGAGALPDL